MEKLARSSILIPPTIKREPLELRPDQADVPPGGIEIDATGKLLLQAIKYRPITSDIIEDFNQLVRETIPATIKKTRIPIITKDIQNYINNVDITTEEVKDYGVISNDKFNYRELYLGFEQVYLNRPSKNGKPVLPYQLRRTLDSYMFEYRVDLKLYIVEYRNGKKIERSLAITNRDQSQSARLGYFPVMTGSIMDNMMNIDKETWKYYGEDPDSPPGHFLIDGNEYNVFMRSKLRTNRLFNYFNKNSATSRMSRAKVQVNKVSLINTVTPFNTRQTSIKQTQFGELIIVIESLKSNVIKRRKFSDDETKLPDYLNLFTFAEFMFDISVETIIKRIKWFCRKQDYRLLLNYLQITIDRHQSNGDPVDYIAQLMGDELTPDNRNFLIKKYKLIFNRDFYSHISYQSVSDAIKKQRKSLLLVFQLTRYLEYILNRREEDNRDSWYNKALEGPSASLFQQFNYAWGRIEAMLSENLAKTFKDVSIGQYAVDSEQNKAIYKDILRNAFNLVQSLESSSNTSLLDKTKSLFGNKTYNSKLGRKEADDSRAQMIEKGVNTQQRYAELTKIVSNAFEEDQSFAIRGIDDTGVEDMAETPESKKCGLRNHRSITCRYSLQRNDADVYGIMVNSEYFRRKPELYRGLAACLINGYIIGWAEARPMVNLIKYMKRRGKLQYDISVVYDPGDNVIFVHTDAFRPIRPFLVVENGQALIDVNNAWDLNFDQLYRRGYVEYVDIWEMQYNTVCYDIHKLRGINREKQLSKNQLEYYYSQYISKFGSNPKLERLHSKHTYTNKLQELEVKLNQTEKSIQELRTKRDQLNKEFKERNAEFKRLVDQYNQDSTPTNFEKLRGYSRNYIGDKANLTTISSLESNFNQYYLVPNQYRIKQLETRIEMHRETDRVYRTRIQRVKNYNETKGHNAADSVISQLTSMKQLLTSINKSFSAGHTYPVQLRILENKPLEINEHLKNLLSYETRDIIDSAPIIVKTSFYQRLNQLITDMRILIVSIRKKNDSRRFILAKRFLNQTRIKLLVQLGKLDRFVERLEDTFDQEQERIKNASHIEIKLPDVDNNELKKFLEEQIIKNELNYAESTEITYEYCELDPNAVLGVSVSLLPWASNNDNVRNAYAASQSKQAMSTSTPSELLRFTNRTLRLLNAERPIAETQLTEQIGLHRLPYGQMFITAIVDWRHNRDDSIIMSQRAVDNGAGLSARRMTHTVSLEKSKMENKNVQYEFGIPKGLRNEKSFANITKSGLPKVGSILRAGDVIIGSYSVVKNGKDGLQEDNSLIAQIGHEGMVDMAEISTNSKGIPVANVRVVNIKTVQQGDKMAHRSAQKDTVSKILPDDEMPRIEGLDIVPDIIINYAALPSRLTINLLIEALASAHGALRNTRVNASSFRSIPKTRFERTLRKYGHNPTGKYKMIYGASTPIEGEVFLAPMYWSFLEHIVDKKIQARSTGVSDPRTRRPLGGKGRGGGIKLGEMEISAISAQRGYHVLQERTCLSAGGIERVWCSNCGIMAVRSPDSLKRGESIFKCMECDTRSRDVLRKCTVPYMMVNANNQLAGLGLQMKLRSKK